MAPRCSIRTLRHPRLRRLRLRLRLRPGLTIVEVVVILAIAVIAVLVLLVMIPHGREQARLLGCQKNLGQIGVALALYDQHCSRLPVIERLAALDDFTEVRPAGPLRTLLEELQLPDLAALKPGEPAPPPEPGLVPHGIPLIGFVCQSDPHATAGIFGAPVSYRACTGDSPDGGDGHGAFAPGRVLRLSQIESGDGTGFTAGFSERLVGDRQPNHVALEDYLGVGGPIGLAGCPPVTDFTEGGWRGDAGSSWTWSDYRSTLYNHSLPPNGRPSCVALDGQSALMSASSGHVRGVNVLMLDGRVTVMRPATDFTIWRELARINDRGTTGPDQ